MENRIQILKSKLVSPYTSDTIKRERLYSLLSEISRKRLTIVIAGAGFGKTTLIAEVSEHFNFDAVWYRVDKSDRDSISFLSYLIAGIKKHYPGFGEETLDRIGKTQTLTREYESVLTVFLGEIERDIKKDITIIIDDYHFIQDSDEINNSLEFIIENASKHVHFVMISRVDPGLHLSRFRARREVLDIKEENIIFTITEVDKLFSQVFDISLHNDSLESLHQKTDGWVSGLILFYHSIKGKNQEEIKEVLYNLKGSHRNISNYLEENVFDMQPDQIKDFLIKTSILSRVNATFCDKYLGIRNSRKILKELEENHLFTFPLIEERNWFSYHQLLRDFLQNKLYYEFDDKALQKLHNDAAAIWEEMGESEEALMHYLRAEQFDKVSILLGRWGLNKLIKEGRLQLISSYLKEIPDSYFNKDPWIQYMQAHVYELSGKLEDAIPVYNKALKTFRRQKSITGELMCFKSLFFANLIYGNHKSAEDILKALPEEIKNFPQLNADILGILTILAAHLGKITQSEKYYKEGLALLDKLENKSNKKVYSIFKGIACCFTGDFLETLKINEELGDVADVEDRGDYYYHLYAAKCQMASFSYYNIGDFKKGTEMAMTGLELVAEKGLQDYIEAWLMIALGFNEAALGKTSEAINHGRESLKIFKDGGSRWGQAQAYYLLHYINARTDNITLAEQYARSGLEVIEGMTLPVEEGVLKVSLARLFIKGRQFSKARPLLEDAERHFKKSKPGLSMVYLLATRFYWEQKQKKPSFEKLASALKLCKENKYDVWILFEKNWIIPLLIELYANGKMKEYIANIFEILGSSVIGDLKQLQKTRSKKVKETVKFFLDRLNERDRANPLSLRIYCLGKFSVYQGEKEISSEKWKSKKAKMLFKYLVNNRNRGFLSRDVLMELLWPEEDPFKSINRLHDALYSLRKVIEPNTRGSGNTSYLLREGDAYKIFLGEEGWLDVEVFRKEIKLGNDEEDPGKAIKHYLKAEELYQGDFLEEDIYVDWCADERAVLKEEFLDLLSKIVDYYDNQGDYEKSIEYAGKYLKTEKFTENIYQQLMIFYYYMGNKTMMAKTYERCKENMKKLDIPVSHEIDDLYHKLTSM